MPDNDPPLPLPDPGELLARAMHTDLPSGGGHWTPPEPEELAALLPQYHIESLLGHGGMGAVYKGRQAALDRPVAIKLLPAEVAADPQFVARFQREARTLAKLQHNGIVTVYDFGQTSAGHLYFVMEFVDGTDLQRILKGPGLKPEQAFEMIAQICDALYYAHRQGVIHRDIKPANILVTKDGRAKVADFGLARPLIEDDAGGLTGTNVIMGTPDYMAPEQRTGVGHPDHRADIFALGVMLYEMLTGQRPHGAFQPPSHRVQVDVRIDEVVLKALQQEPDRRYQQASEMKKDVDTIRHTPKPAPAVAPPKRIPRTLLSNAATALVVIVAAIGSVFAYRHFSQARVARESTLNAPAVPDFDAGLVSWWKGDGDARDAAGTHHGDLHGVTFAPGKYGQALSFNGVNSSVSIPPDSAWAVGKRDFTIALWAKFRTANVRQALLSCSDGRDSDDRWIVFLWDGALLWHSNKTTWLGGENRFASTDESAWHHIAITRRGSIVGFYIDGAARISQVGFRSVAPLAGALVLGAAEGESYFDGLLDDIRIYDRELPAEEIQDLSGHRSSPSDASTDRPWINSLGMKFVPVPGTKVLFSIWDTRVQDYAIYAAANPKVDGAWRTQNRDGVPAGRELDHPVVGVSWEDAQAFCQWLTEKEIAEGKLPKGLKYRLPSDEEWSWAVGLPPELGTTPAEKAGKNSVDFPWGKDYPPTRKVGNYADEAYHAKFPVKKNRPDNQWIEGYSDGYATTSPVGGFPANAYGLYDTGGNVWQWCEDWFDDKKEHRVLRGAAWDYNGRGNLLSSYRNRNAPTGRSIFSGFRCVVGVSAPSATPAAR